LKNNPPAERVIIITGHYGSGKTEIALNMAFQLKERESFPVTLADLDIMNPYFRSREKRVPLEEAGIKLIGGSIEDSLTGVPALSAEVQGQLNLGEGYLILDVGGDPEGARLLGRYPREWEDLKGEKNLAMLFVVNPYRPETPDLPRALTMLRMIEEYSGLSITGIAANGHLLKSTTEEEVLEGWRLATTLSEKTNIPLKFCTLPDWVERPAEIPENLIMPLTLRHRKEWMS
jgi:hypothetical protein